MGRTWNWAGLKPASTLRSLQGRGHSEPWGGVTQPSAGGLEDGPQASSPGTRVRVTNHQSCKGLGVTNPFPSLYSAENRDSEEERGLPGLKRLDRSMPHNLLKMTAPRLAPKIKPSPDRNAERRIQIELIREGDGVKGRQMRQRQRWEQMLLFRENHRRGTDL